MNHTLYLIEKERNQPAPIPEWVRAERLERISSSPELQRIANAAIHLPRHRRAGK